MATKNFCLIASLLLALTSACGGEPTVVSGDGATPAPGPPPEVMHVHGESVRNLMPAYYDFVWSLKESGYSFMDFDRYWAADKQKLPTKLIVVRHDVHLRDIDGAYRMHRIEHELLGAHSATYFVMLGFPPEQDDQARQDSYLGLISWLKTEGVDTQPHISPNDMYVTQALPSWRSKTTHQLHAMIDGQYAITKFTDGIDIEPKSGDPLGIASMNQSLLGLLRDYNELWKAQTGLEARYYAAHGSHIAINHVMNNATLLDQRELLSAGVYEFDTYNTQIHQVLGDLSDNEQPDWMDQPDSIRDGRYELLAHPWLWQPDNTAERVAKEPPADLSADVEGATAP